MEKRSGIILVLLISFVFINSLGIVLGYGEINQNSGGDFNLVVTDDGNFWCDAYNDGDEGTGLDINWKLVDEQIRKAYTARTHPSPLQTNDYICFQNGFSETIAECCGAVPCQSAGTQGERYSTDETIDNGKWKCNNWNGIYGFWAETGCTNDFSCDCPTYVEIGDRCGGGEVFGVSHGPDSIGISVFYSGMTYGPGNQGGAVDYCSNLLGTVYSNEYDDWFLPSLITHADINTCVDNGICTSTIVNNRLWSSQIDNIVSGNAYVYEYSTNKGVSVSSSSPYPAHCARRFTLDIPSGIGTCDSSQVIMKLSDVTNAHGELWDGTGGYATKICYDDFFGKDYLAPLPHKCLSGNKVLGLSASTNAHADTLDTTGYDTDVCYGDLVCVKATGSCPDGKTNILKLSSDTNAHLGLASSGYSTLICCSSEAAGAVESTCDSGDGCLVGCDPIDPDCGGGTTTCEFNFAAWSELEVYEGTSVRLNVEGTSGCNGKEVMFEVREVEDFAFDTPATTNPVNVVFDGTTLTGTWTAEWIDDGAFQGDPEYVFKASLVSNSSVEIDNSGELSVLTREIICEDGTTLCEEAVGPYCYEGTPCPDGEEPPTNNNGICEYGEGCTSVDCSDSDVGAPCVISGTCQDSCIAGAVCSNGMCSGGGDIIDQCIVDGIAFCFNYLTPAECSVDDCDVAVDSVEDKRDSGYCALDGVLCECVWDGEKCGPNSERTTDGYLAGTCFYDEDASNKDCEDGFLSYSWTKDWDWGTGNGWTSWASSGISDSIETDYEKIGATWYYDPYEEYVGCKAGSTIVECPASIQVGFFNVWNFIIVIVILVAIYFLMERKKKKK